MKSPAASPKEELLHLAETALDEGRAFEALDLCQQLLSDDPEDAAARYLEAEAYRELREPEEAEERYRDILSDDATHADAWSGLGSALFDQCRFEESRRAHARALRLVPDHPESLYGRAMIRERQGDAYGARRDYTRAWQASPRFPLPQPLDERQVRDLIRDAATEAPPEVGAFLHGAPLIMLEVPESDTCEAYEPPASPGELLGHFAAVFSPPPGVSARASAMPPALLIYRRNLERYADSRDRLVVALRESVLSQVADWLSQATVSE